MASRTLDRLRGGLTFANVCSLLALTVALGTGGAYAAGSIGSHEIKNKSIRSVDIKNGQVKAADVGKDAVDSTHVRADSLTGQDLATGSVGSAEIGGGAVDGAKVLDGSLTSADLAGADLNGELINLGAGAVANGRCSQYEITVVGAKAGEAALVSTQGALQNGVLIYGQRVATDGHVTIDVCNLSGTTQAAIISLPIRVTTFG